MKKELEELTEEIGKLRKEVRELREAGAWPRIQYVPYPTYVPYYPQPSYVPWWGTSTFQWTNVPAVQTTTATSYKITNNTGTVSAWQAAGSAYSVGL